MISLNVVATPKFFSRKFPKEEAMELVARRAELGFGYAYIFLRANSDSDYPSRVRISLSASQCELLAEELNSVAASLRGKQ